MDNNETTELVFKQLDLIEDSVQNIINLWEVTMVPTNLIDLNKAHENDKEFFKQYNNTLQLLIDQCKKDAEEMGVTQIPMELFSSHIDLIKSSFKKAAKEVQE